MFARLLVVVLALAMAAAARADGPQNLGFEGDTAGAAPAEWIVPPMCEKGGWTVTVLDEGATEGSKFLVLKRPEGATGSSGFGNVLQCFDAAALRGKNVTFGASVRYEGPAAGRAQMWLRVDRPNGQSGFFDNMSDRPVTAKEWGKYEISGFVAPDAAQICLGLMVTGSPAGVGFLDSVTFSVAEGQDPNQPSAELDARAVANLAAFARLYGYVRWYHPSDEAAAVAQEDWDLLAIRGVRAVEGCKTTEELAAALRRVFAPLAPSVRIGTQAIEGEFDPKSMLAGGAAPSRVTAWSHFGMGVAGNQNSIYKSNRAKWEPAADPTPKGVPSHGSHVTARIFGPILGSEGADLDGVWCRVPLTVYASSSGTAPKAAPVAPADALAPFPGGFSASGSDRSTRLADVIICWNVFEHFYPYFEEVKVDWPAKLPEYLKLAAKDADDTAFLDTLRRMTATLRDGHLQVMHQARMPQWWLPICWDFAGETLVITHLPGTGPDEQGGPFSAGAASDLRRGDTVVKINGKPIDECIEDAAARISGADAWVRFRTLNDLRRPDSGEPVVLTVASADPGGATRDVAVKPVQSGEWAGPHEPRPAVTAEVQPGVWYIDLTRAVDDDFTRLVPTLTGAKGIIFDMRGYPSKFGTAALGYFTDTAVQCAQWNIPVCAYPDGRDRTWNQSRWPVPPAKPRLTARVAYITEGQAISYAETYMGIVEHYKLGEIVGRTTAGANGNVNSFMLPGGYSVSFTGMRVLRHDGSPHHLVGIKPTVPVERTVAGIAAGRDEFLEAAIKTVTGAEPEKPMIIVPAQPNNKP